MFEYFVPRFGSPGAVWRSPKYLVHPLGDMNVSRKFNGNPSDGYLDISATKPVSTWLRCSGFSWCVWIPGVDPFSFPDNMSVCRVMSWMHWCVYLCGICSCCCSAMRLCPAHYTHTHTHPASTHWGQRLPSWQHSDSLMAPEMSTQLLRLGKNLASPLSGLSKQNTFILWLQSKVDLWF